MSQITNAVAARDNSIVNLIPSYQVEFSEVLPEHIKAVAFIRQAQGALRKDANLRKAAEADPASFIFALREAARLGHAPASPEFYLVPLGGKVEGWEGYRGVVERIYRAGAVATVKAEVVYQNDQFRYSPDMPRPEHEVDWFDSDRGPIKGAYAYAEMVNGSTSKVVIIGRAYIDKVRAESRGSSSPSSPWKKWEEAMVLKTVVHRLEPWVPTSTEWRREQLRAVRDVATEPRPVQPIPHDADTGEVIDAEPVE